MPVNFNAFYPVHHYQSLIKSLQNVLEDKKKMQYEKRASIRTRLRFKEMLLSDWNLKLENLINMKGCNGKPGRHARMDV